METTNCPSCGAPMTLQTVGPLHDKILQCGFCETVVDVPDEVEIRDQGDGFERTIRRRDLSPGDRQDLFRQLEAAHPALGGLLKPGSGAGGKMVTVSSRTTTHTATSTTTRTTSETTGDLDSGHEALIRSHFDDALADQAMDAIRNARASRIQQLQPRPKRSCLGCSMLAAICVLAGSALSLMSF